MSGSNLFSNCANTARAIFAIVIAAALAVPALAQLARRLVRSRSIRVWLPVRRIGTIRRELPARRTGRRRRISFGRYCSITRLRRLTQWERP